MNKNIKIYIAGHKGLVGSAIDRVLTKNGYNNIIRKTHSELDLRDREKVFNFFEKEKPEWVFLSAAKVGGIYANNTYPVDFLLYNLQIQNNIIEASYKYDVQKLMFLGSSCIYPKECHQPIKEEYLLSGYLESTNQPYALAKIAGIELCDAYNRQYNTNYIAVMPCNLYGINDNYHPENAHVIPMLIRRFHEAKINDLKETTIWGSGTPLREFMCSDDLAEACIYLMENKNTKDIGKFINIGSGKEVTIKELAELIKKTVGFEGEIKLNSSKPDGTMRKLLDVSKINALGWKYKIELEDGLRMAYEDFLKNYNK
ncbi:GDP-L-fucose synthase family protein [Brachyspira murdochii]|uniref:GDP-L-fucose synthase family protein n=1 Tax=Brachyspira murdochii TaxID=84378 RepID=UPI0012F49BEA|nr:GDP-L-fucose synthase [Brachyspira murdochii]